MDPLLELVIIWIGVFVAIIAAKKTKLTPVLYFLAVGAVLVNTGILPTETSPFIGGLAEFGIVAIMFALGFEENTANFLTSVKRSWGIALFGAIAPFTTAYLAALYFWGDTNMAIMCGLAMTATAVSLTMVSLKGEGLSNSTAATGIMTSAVLDDVGSLALVAILVPITTGAATLSIAGIGLIVGKAIAFFAVVTLLGAIIFPHGSSGLLARFPFLQKFGVRQIFQFAEGEHTTLSVLTIAAVVGVLAHWFGFHPAIGAYMAGLVLREEYFHSVKSIGENQYEKTRKVVDNVAFSWIGPVFFVDLGTRIVFDMDMFIGVIPEVVILTTGLFVMQILSASLAARYTGNFSPEESVMIGLGMLGRAELAFVVMDIAYIENQIFTDEVFYTLMITAFWLNIAVPVTIKWWKPYYTGEKPTIWSART
jgi:Kef-type K+ transport system membrane component KefB